MRRSLLSLAGVALMASACAGDFADVADVAGIALGEEGMLPPTDEVHTFLDLLDRLARMDG